MNPVIISFANNRGNYYAALARLRLSLANNWSGDFIGFTDEHTIGAPPHMENPYAFKIYCFRKALEQGYRQILYVDSSVYAVRNINPIFDIIMRDGYIMQEAGQYTRTWTNQATLDYFGLQREDLGDQVMYGNAGFLGLNFDDLTAMRFFIDWEAAMLAGMFKGSWNDHRHDMACGSIIANRLGMKFQKGDEILEYASPEDPIKNDTIIFKAQGL